jgi:hypothetical protein
MFFLLSNSELYFQKKRGKEMNQVLSFSWYLAMNGVDKVYSWVSGWWKGSVKSDDTDFIMVEDLEQKKPVAKTKKKRL